TVLAGSALVATPALAQDDLGISISGNATIVSDYRFRGVGLSGGDPAIQGGIDLGTDAGFYVGTWASSIDGGDVYGEMELDIYAGWSGELTDGLGFDVGALYYLYPTNDLDPADYWELYASISPSVGPAELTFGVAYAPSQDSLDFGGPDDNLYLYGDIGIGIPDTPISVWGHLGYTDGALTFTADSNALDYGIGADLAIGDNLSIGIAYIGVDDDGADINGVTDDTVVGTIGVSF
ncbi:MAG TPA: TorF family putative porin, partial [Sphingomonadaceae bacterium]|nr:TorF family putative porin [Sphingomonadaceae bacterium]